MDSFIRTASIAAFLTFRPDLALANCDGSVKAVDRAMQDGLGALEIANALLEEALQGVDAATATDAEVCGFLRGSTMKYQEAQGHFRRCQVTLEQTLESCPDVDWTKTGIGPQLCKRQLADVIKQLSTMPGDVARFCEE